MQKLLRNILFATFATLTTTQVTDNKPEEFTIQINDKMPNVAVMFQGYPSGLCNLDNNVKTNTLFVLQCTQNLYGTDANCTADPSKVQNAELNSTQLMGVGDDFTNHQQGGFVTDGRMASGKLEILQNFGSNPNFVGYDDDIYLVFNITEDAWHWSQKVAGGAISLSIESSFIDYMKNETTMMSGFFLQLGPIADQVFAGGQATPTVTLYVGGGDYSTIFDTTGRSSITLSPDATTGLYSLESVGFGQATFDQLEKPQTPTSAFYQFLGYPGQPQSAILSLDFVGMGLPYYLWYQVTNLLYKVDTTVASQLSCEPLNGGICQLEAPCANYTKLWENGWSFKIKFTDVSDYIIFPIGALAADDEYNQCNIYIQYLDEGIDTQSSNVIFGTMFLQQYAQLFTYDLTANTTTLQMYIDDTNTLYSSYLGAAIYSTSHADPFTILHNKGQQIYVNHDEAHYKTTIGGDLGFQGTSQFQVSLLGQYIQTWQKDCYYKKDGLQWSKCDTQPILATNYFDNSVYFNNQTQQPFEANYAGYNYSGYIYESGICTRTHNTNYFCTTDNEEFYAADSVYWDDWNYDSLAGAGSFGLGASSPIWKIIGSPSSKKFDVYLTNFNGWTWADPSYVATTQNSLINFGTYDTTYGLSDIYTSIAPFTGGSYLFGLDSFGFGKTNVTNQTEFYESLINWNTIDYGVKANKTSMALNFRGLGLPAKEFKSFANLLSVITKGESTCLQRKSGYCALSNPCERYAEMGVWDYDFKIKFTTTSDDLYFRVPLASFAANYDAEGGVCVVFVEYLDSQFSDSQFILLGGMFFQSVYAQFNQFGKNAVQVDLYKNKNALEQTYFGNDVYEQGESVFQVPTAEIKTDEMTEKNGLPTFGATIAGITDPHQYYLLDFETSNTIVWSKDCQTTGIGNFPAGPCSDQPTYMTMGFDGSTLPESTGTFESANFGGFVVSGKKYTSELCFGEVDCKYINVFGVDQVSQDNWMYNQDATYGIIGMGPGSFIWEGFADPVTRLAFYSIELARLPSYSSGLGAGETKPSNITFGSTNNASYIGLPSVAMVAQSDYTYALNNLSFGIIYQNNSKDSSQYFYEMENSYPVSFSTNFKGLGLPASLYSEFQSLLTYTTGGNATCDNTVDGICVLPGRCEDYMGITDYFFNFTFTNELKGNYMRVPLAAFAESIGQQLDNEKCNLNVNYLSTTNTQSSNIILGGMFFQEFFGEFVNDFNNPEGADQAAQIFVGQNSIYQAYIGNEILPEGNNPFIPVPPTPTPDSGDSISGTWIGILSMLGGIMLAFLGYALYKYKITQNKKTVRGSNVVYGTAENKINNSETTNISRDEERLLNV